MSFVAVCELALAVFFAASVQTAVGFGFGMLLVPGLLALGHTLPEAVALTLGAGFIQTVVGLHALQGETRWSEAMPLALAQWLAVPLGVGIMVVLHEAGPARVRQGVGAVLLLVLTMRLVARPTPREKASRPWSLVAAACSGILSGAVGMGGPPLVLLALSQRFSADRFRTFLWEQFLLVTPVQLAALTFRFGMPALASFGLGLVLAPVLYLGTRAGRLASSRWDASLLARAAVAMLFLLAAMSLLSPFVGPGRG